MSKSMNESIQQKPKQFSQKSKILMLFLSTILFQLLSFAKCQFDLQDYGVILDAKHRSKYHWGTYKPNLYFAMKNRRNTSQVFGLMWYGAGEENYERTKDFSSRLRHDCKMEDNLNYRWEVHNGLDYGEEVMEDQSLNLKLTTKFIKNEYNFTNHSWDVSIEGEFLDKNTNDFSGSVGLLLYTAFENHLVEDKAFFTVNTDKNVKEIEGQEKGKKEFYMKFFQDEGEVLENSVQKYRKIYNETWRIKKFVSEDLKNSETVLNDITEKRVRNGDREEIRYTRNPQWQNAKFTTKDLKQPNIVVLQYIFKKPFKIYARYNVNGFAEEAEKYENNQEVKKIVNKINENMAQKKAKFEAKFDQIYKINFEDSLIQKLISNEKDSKIEENKKQSLVKMSQQALSNVLGSIAHFWGAIKINLEGNLQPGQYHKGFRYAVEQKELYTGTPSRSFFPRGFLWDEGFHNVLISQWDINISIDIINSWLSTMSATGWMAREQIRGMEAESKVPKKFLVQDKLMANPPTLIFALNNVMNYYKYNFETENLKTMNAFLKKCHDKFSSWYEWFEIYQKSSDKKSYQWYGRTTEHNLASGLDDLPRGMNPNIYEKHLDLNIWVIEHLKTLRNLSEIFDYELMQHFQKKVEKMSREIETTFYDEKKQILADFLGPQYKLIKSNRFSEAVPPYFWRGDGKCGSENPNSLGLPSECNPYSDMPCCSEFGWCGNSPAHCKCEKCSKALKLEEMNLEKENIFNPHVGYVNLFPLIFGYLKIEDKVFRNTLQLLANPEILNSNFGIRSLSKSDLLYHTGEDYWRGNIWINMNYLTLRGLKKFYYNDPDAKAVYEDLRFKIIKTIFTNWKKSKMFYEQYSDIDGTGLRARPFNGWSSLVLNIITEKYDD